MLTLWTRAGLSLFCLISEENDFNFANYRQVKDNGELEIKDALIQFDPAKKYRGGIRASLGTNLTITNSRLTWVDDTVWGCTYTYGNSNMVILNSVVEHDRSVTFQADLVVIKDSTSQPLTNSLNGKLNKGKSPALKNIPSQHNKWGVYHKGKGDWAITGERTKIEDNQEDLVIGSSGSIYILSGAFSNFWKKKNASGMVVEL